MSAPRLAMIGAAFLLSGAAHADTAVTFGDMPDAPASAPISVYGDMPVAPIYGEWQGVRIVVWDDLPAAPAFPRPVTFADLPSPNYHFDTASIERPIPRELEVASN